MSLSLSLSLSLSQSFILKIRFLNAFRHHKLRFELYCCAENVEIPIVMLSAGSEASAHSAYLLPCFPSRCPQASYILEDWAYHVLPLCIICSKAFTECGFCNSGGANTLIVYLLKANTKSSNKHRLSSLGWVRSAEQEILVLWPTLQVRVNSNAHTHACTQMQPESFFVVIKVKLP